MLNVTRSPLTSPALRTMASASSYVAMPSPLSRPSYSPFPHTCLPTSMRTPRGPPIDSGTSVHGSYFSIVGASSTPCRFTVPCSPGSPASSPIHASISSILLSHGTTNNNVVQQLGTGRSIMNSASRQATSDNTSTCATSVDAQARRKPTFKLNLPHPTLSRDDSFEAALAGITCSLGTPCKLTRSDSSDSVMTLKPIKGRVLTPYPKIDDSEWVEDVDEAMETM